MTEGVREAQGEEATRERARSILDMTSDEAKHVLFDPASYSSLDLPNYFNFTELLVRAKAVVDATTPYRNGSPKIRALSGVNHVILDNKDGAFGWRPMQLVHPILYAELVSLLTDPANWKFLQSRFVDFQSDPRILCKSIMLIDEPVSLKATAVGNWWAAFEQESIRLSLDYKYLASTDIEDCYGSLYTHSIAWALHGRAYAKENRKSGLGNELDALFQDMHEGQTNGIPQGNSVSDLVAEVVLGHADQELSRELHERQIEDYQVLRYRDDYRIFTNSKEDAQRILLALTGVLSSLNFKLNGPKTGFSDDVIGSSIKQDKRYWNRRASLRGSLLKQLLLVRELGLRFPNSGSLVTALTRFREGIERRDEKPRDSSVLIPVAVDIMYHNPRAYPHIASILSKLLSFDDSPVVADYLQRIRAKFSDVPNTGFLDIWMQRVALGYSIDSNYGESLCNAVSGCQVEIWNGDWLSADVKGMFQDGASIVDWGVLARLGPVITVAETQLFASLYSEDRDFDLIFDGEEKRD